MPAPFRPCDHCAKPAVVHNTVIVGGKVTEVHLCEEHASAAGIQMPGHAPIDALLARAAVSAGVHALFLECHPDPKASASDAATVQPLDAVPALLRGIGRASCRERVSNCV